MPVPDFSPGEVLTAAAMDSIGLWLVKTQTIDATVPSVEVTSCFNADYDNYLVTISGGVSSAAIVDMRLQLGSTNTGYYGSRIGTTWAADTVIVGRDNNGALFSFVATGTTAGLQGHITINSPNLAKPTTVIAHQAGSATNAGSFNYNGYVAGTTQYTAFTLSPSSGTLTGGTIRVYGYRN
jgi:hypothetical protein